MHVAQPVVADAQIACELGVLGGAGGQTFCDHQALLVQPERCLAVAQCPLDVSKLAIGLVQFVSKRGSIRVASGDLLAKPQTALVQRQARLNIVKFRPQIVNLFLADD